MHMRTREDLIEMKGDVRALKDGAARGDIRQSEFEKEVARKLAEHAEHTDGKIVELNGRVGGLDTQITEIREERIAEKAQWRGPEKVIAVLVSLGGAIALLVALKELFLK